MTTRNAVSATTITVEKIANQTTGVVAASAPAVRACTVANPKTAKLVRWIPCHKRRGIRRWRSDVSSTATSR